MALDIRAGLVKHDLIEDAIARCLPWLLAPAGRVMFSRHALGVYSEYELAAKTEQ